MLRLRLVCTCSTFVLCLHYTIGVLPRRYPALSITLFLGARRLTPALPARAGARVFRVECDVKMAACVAVTSTIGFHRGNSPCTCATLLEVISFTCD